MTLNRRNFIGAGALAAGAGLALGASGVASAAVSSKTFNLSLIHI